MTRVALLLLGAALCAAPAATATPADAQTQSRAGSYKAPRTAFGQPDLQGFWTNVTLTPETRPAALGTRAVHTPQEVAAMEARVQEEVEEGNRNTDPNAPPPAAGGEKPPEGTRPEFAAAGGAVGGYNRGWLEAGNTVMRVRGEPRTSLITTPDGRAPAPKPGAKVADLRGTGGLGSFDSHETRSLGERCIMGFGRNAGPPMFANGFYNNNYQIVQTPDHVAIMVEMVHDTRIVRLNGRHRTDGIRPWMGDSIGRWDGDTLVVETVNVPQRQAYKGAWEQLKVTERFTRVGPDRLHYAFTVEDPTVWDRPWGGEYEFSPLNGIIYEYACHEGNYALPGMLAGARAEEAAAKGGAPAAPTGSN